MSCGERICLLSKEWCLLYKSNCVANVHAAFAIRRFDAADKEEKFEDAAKKIKGKKEENKSK
jgi:hypothetical protein